MGYLYVFYDEIIIEYATPLETRRVVLVACPIEAGSKLLAEVLGSRDRTHWRLSVRQTCRAVYGGGTGADNLSQRQ